MLKNITIGALAIFSLHGCISSTSLKNQVQVKSMLSSDFEKYLEEDIQIKSQVGLSQTQVENENWEDTQKPKCKIYASSSLKKNDPTVKFYWDGKCKDGYAIGLGREFSMGKQIYLEAIGQYDGGKNLPQYFYNFNKVNKIFHIGNLKNKPENILLLQGMLDNNNIFKRSIIFQDVNNKDIYEKMSYDDAGTLGKIYKSAGGLTVIEQIYTTDPLVKQQMIVYMQNKKLYSFELFNDGRKFFVDVTSNSPVLVNPSPNLQDFLTKKLAFLDNKTSNTNDLDLKVALDAEKKVDTYINLTCASSNYIKEIGKDNYFAICSPYKSLGIFKNKIEQGKASLSQQRQKRLEDVQQ